MSNGTPQFATAEYSGQPAEAACKACRKPLGDPHYRVNGALVCASCTQRIKAQMPDDSATTPKMRPVKAIGVLTLIGLASPFLELADPAHGLIGLVILFVGLRIAWRLTAGRPIDIVGPIDEPIRATPA